MGVIKPKSGDTITPASVSDMYNSVKAVVDSVPTASISDSCFGPQSLPSCVPHLASSTTVGSDSTGFTVSASSSDRTIVSPHGSTPSYRMDSETKADVTANWKTILHLTPGGGYELPPCKVLVMFDTTVDAITKHASWTYVSQGWFSVYYIADIGAGTTVYWEARNMGMVHGYADATATDDSASATVINHLVDEAVSIWFVIDQTGATSNWTLESIVVKAALGTGIGRHDVGPLNMVLNNANLSFVAFYKDS